VGVTAPVAGVGIGAVQVEAVRIACVRIACVRIQAVRVGTLRVGSVVPFGRFAPARGAGATHCATAGEDFRFRIDGPSPEASTESLGLERSSLALSL